MKKAFAAAALTLYSLAVQAADQPTYCNPLDLNYVYRQYTPDGPICIEGADPVVILFRDQYYLFSSVTEGYWVSDNLAQWRFIACSRQQLPGIDEYAPAVLVRDDAIYWHQGYFKKDLYRTRDPQNPNAWERVTDNLNMHHDPDMTVDPDTGKLWMSFGCGDVKKESISVQEIDPARWETIGDPVACLTGDQARRGWERCFDNHTSSGWGYIEGSQLFKNRDRWYLVYSGYSLFKGYANGLFTASSPTGPYTYHPGSPVSHKNTGFIGGAGHGYFFRDRYGNWWNVTCASVYVSDSCERRISLFPAGIDAEGNLYTTTVLGDYPITLPQGPRDHSKPPLAGWMLLSKGVEVSASSQATGPALSPRYGEKLHPSQGLMHTRQDLRPLYAVDEDVRTLWSAASGQEGEWFQVDLGRNCTVHAVQINFAEYNLETRDLAEKYHAYRLETTSDGQTWAPLVDKWENRTHEPHDYLPLAKPANIRALRIVNRHMPGKGWFALRDVRVFGTDQRQAPQAPSEFTVTRHPDDLGATVKWEASKGADAYVVRYGLAPDKLYNQYQVYGTSAEVRTLNAGVDYFFRVDAFNGAGYVEGRTPIVLQTPDKR